MYLREHLSVELVTAVNNDGTDEKSDATDENRKTSRACLSLCVRLGMFPEGFRWNSRIGRGCVATHNAAD